MSDTEKHVTQFVVLMPDRAYSPEVRSYPPDEKDLAIEHVKHLWAVASDAYPHRATAKLIQRDITILEIDVEVPR